MIFEINLEQQLTQVSVIEVFGVTTRGRSSSITEPAGNVLLIIIMMMMAGMTMTIFKTLMMT